MNASATFSPRLKRLVLLIGAIGATAAVFSGPALAEPGLPTVTGAVEQVVPVAADTVTGAVSAAEQVVDQAPVPPAESLDGLVETATGPAESVLSEGLGNQAETAATVLPSVGDPGRAADGGGASTSSASQQPVSVAAFEEVREAATPAAEPAARIAVTADLARSRPATRPGNAAPSRKFPPASLSTPAVRSPGSARAGTDAPTYPPAPPSDGALLGYDALLLPASAPVLLVAALLGLFALVMPRAGGPRLHPAVALVYAADVRFRLARPG